MTDAAVLRSSVVIYVKLKDQGCSIKWPKMDGICRSDRCQIRGVSRRTVVNHWAYARAWLHREITKGNEPLSR